MPIKDMMNVIQITHYPFLAAFKWMQILKQSILG